MRSPTAASRRIVGVTNGKKDRRKKKVNFQFFMIYLFFQLVELEFGGARVFIQLEKLEFGGRCVNNLSYLLITLYEICESIY